MLIPQKYLSNIRFYILLANFFAGIIAACYLRLTIDSDQLYVIRLEQLFGFASLLYLYIALLISPLSKVIPKGTSISLLLFSRRAIGVSAALFASFHGAIAFWGQLGGFGGVELLPERFKVALLFGVIALIIIVIMALTSFDKIIAYMTLKRWKLLHRFVYAASVLSLLHVWMIGTHAAYSWAKALGFIALAILFGLEAWRVALNFGKKPPNQPQANRRWYIFALLWLASLLLLALLPSVVKNYHAEHHNGTTENQSRDHGDNHETP